MPQQPQPLWNHNRRTTTPVVLRAPRLLVTVLLAASTLVGAAAWQSPHEGRLTAFQLPPPHPKFTPRHLTTGDGQRVLRLEEPTLTVTPTRQIIDEFGPDLLRDGLHRLDRAGGSRFRVRVDWSAPDDRDVQFAADDGHNVITFDPAGCGAAHGHVGVAKLHRTPLRTEQVQYTSGGDIALCPGWSVADRPRRAAVLLAHEIGHLAGLAHVCPDRETAPCGRVTGPASAWDQLMFPLAHHTQTSTDIAGATLARLYPQCTLAPRKPAPGRQSRPVRHGPDERWPTC